MIYLYCLANSLMYLFLNILVKEVGIDRQSTIIPVPILRAVAYCTRFSEHTSKYLIKEIPVGIDLCFSEHIGQLNRCS